MPPTLSPKKLPDRRQHLFGRKQDLAYLVNRAQAKGITAVVGIPAMGKSWLLAELTRYLSTDFAPRHLVGFTESAGETPNIFLRSVIDLYARWLSDSDYLQQAKMVWGQQKDHVVERAGKVFGAVVEKLSKVFEPASEMVGASVKETLQQLAEINQTLRSGEDMPPTLPYDRAHDLVDIVARIASRPVTLVLDQWEQSLSVAAEAKVLSAFVRHVEEWPHCHVFLSSNAEDPAYALIEDLRRRSPGTVEIYELCPMKLEDRASQQALLEFLHKRVPATRSVPDEDVLRMIDGYPGTIAGWTNEYWAERMISRQDLEARAAQAQEYRFIELETLLPSLSAEERKVAIRLAVLPLRDIAAWNLQKEATLDGETEEILDDLKVKSVLESVDPPTFGHQKRTEAALQWFLKHRTVGVRQHAASLVFQLAGRAQDPSPVAFQYAALLARVGPIAGSLRFPPLADALWQVGASLVGDSRVEQGLLVSAAAAVKSDDARSPVAPLLAMGIFNSLNDSMMKQELDRRDAMLEELRSLVQRFPGNANLPGPLAMGLMNCLTKAGEENKPEQRDLLLQELRQLAAAYPNDAGVRFDLAQGLRNTLKDLNRTDQFDQHGRTLCELRELSQKYPDDSRVRSQLANGLFNTLLNSHKRCDLNHRDALLEELRTLARRHPGDGTLGLELAKGLQVALHELRASESLPQRDKLLEELRNVTANLNQNFSADRGIRVPLAMTLFNCHLYALEEKRAEEVTAFSKELRALAERHPRDSQARKYFLWSIRNSLREAWKTGQSEWRDGILDELRSLVTTYPRDAEALRHLVHGLVQTMIQFGAAQSEQRSAFIGEIEALARRYPALFNHDRALQEILAEVREEIEIPRIPPYVRITNVPPELW